MSTALNRWNDSMGVFKEMNFHWDDKLSVSEGKLLLEKGKVKRKEESVVADPSAVAAHLEAMIDPVAKEIFQQMRDEKSDSPAFYERVVDFNRELKAFRLLVWNLELTLEQANNSLAKKRYSELDFKALHLQQLVKSLKGELKRPPVEQRPLLHVDYQERTLLPSISKYPSKRTPIQEIAAAAKKALTLAEASKGKEMESTHMSAFERFAAQLLITPLITEEVAVAFAKLAKHVRKLDLGNATLAAIGDPTVLAPYIPQVNGAIPVDEFLKQLKPKGPICLKDVAHMYEKGIPLDDLVITKFVKKELHFITPAALKTLLKAVSKSCEKVTFSPDLAAMESVRVFLSANSFFLFSGEGEKIFRRSWSLKHNKEL